MGNTQETTTASVTRCRNCGHRLTLNARRGTWGFWSPRYRGEWIDTCWDHKGDGAHQPDAS